MPTKILAIDDSKTMRLAIKITFAAEDAKVTAVSKGSEAVARAKQLQADVVLVDHKLAPGEPSGLEVVQALKANPATANIPVIMLVPTRGGVSEADIMAAGADSYIGKPFDSQELIDKVAASLGRGAAKPRAAVPAARPPVAAAPPPAAAPAARPAPAPAPAPARTPTIQGTKAPAVPGAKAPVAPPAARVPVAAPAPVKPRQPAAAPAPAPARVPAAAAPAPAHTPASAAAPASAGPANIPIAIPIPFTAANAPTSSMLERIRAAAGQSAGAAGIDQNVAMALLQLSHEVVEQIVWEVVPDLAEQIIKEKTR